MKKQYEIRTKNGQKVLGELPSEEGPNDTAFSTYPCELNLPDGTVVEEGKDFEFRRNVFGITEDFVKVTAIAIQGSQASLWDNVIWICGKNKNKSLAEQIRHLSEHYTITKKQ